MVWFLVGGRATDPGSSASPGDDPSSSASNVPAGQVIKLAGAKDFDPFGDPPEENPDQAGNAIDGKQDTAWTTLTYRGRPTLGGLKPGVGLVVDLGSIQNVGSMRLDLDGSPTDVSLYAAPTNAGRPTSLDGLKEIAQKDAAGEQLQLKPRSAVRARYLVVWLTSLPPVDGGFRGAIAEITVRLITPRSESEDPSVGPGATEDDRALLAAHVAGDPEAFGTLFARHRDRLWAVALRTTGNPEDAADALQDAMISAFSRAETFRGDAQVTTWLHRIVVNACLDRIRRSRVRAGAGAARRHGGVRRPRRRARGGRERRAGGGRRALRPAPTAARRPRPAAPGPEGGPGPGRHAGLPGGGGGPDPRVPDRHREEPLLPGPDPAGRPAAPPRTRPGGHPGLRRQRNRSTTRTVP